MPHDNPLVRRLRRAGAIVLAKTNVPQLMLMHETDNPLYGRTQNPWNLERGPGGSSGGEAAIIAAGGSPLGLGNDIGGSIRFPAHSCGICGIKPTTLRLTNAEVRDNLRGMEAFRPQSGPLARHVDDLILALGILNELEPGEIDPQIAPVPLGDPAAVRVEGLRIGMWTDDGYFPASPALRRAVTEAADALRAKGAEVEPFVPLDVPRAVELFFGLMSADGGADAQRVFGRQSARLATTTHAPARPSATVCTADAGRAARCAGQRRTAGFLRTIGRRSTDEYWQLSAARAEYAERFFAHWSTARLDAVICPPHALPALRHGSTADLATVASYCYWANVLGVAGWRRARDARPRGRGNRSGGRTRHGGPDGTGSRVGQRGAAGGCAGGCGSLARGRRAGGHEGAGIAFPRAARFPTTPVDPQPVAASARVKAAVL